MKTQTTESNVQTANPTNATRPKKSSGLLLIVLSLSLMLPAASFAQAWEFTSPGFEAIGGNYTFGNKFSVNRNIAADALGYYYDPQLGWSGPNLVGMFDGNGNLIAATSVDLSNCTRYIHFCYTPISPVGLPPGNDYWIEGVSGRTYIASTTQGSARTRR